MATLITPLSQSVLRLRQPHAESATSPDSRAHLASSGGDKDRGNWKERDGPSTRRCEAAVMRCHRHDARTRMSSLLPPDGNSLREKCGSARVGAFHPCLPRRCRNSGLNRAPVSTPPLFYDAFENGIGQ